MAPSQACVAYRTYRRLELVHLNLGRCVCGRAGVASYRVYFLNGQGRIVRAAELNCDTDEEATEQAKALASGQAVELWDRARLIGRFERPAD